MYAFAQRGDTAAVDEPLYAHYLVNVEPDEERPYKDELLAVQEHYGHLVMANLLQQTQAYRAKNLFAKHMAKQRQHMDLDPELRHAVLAGKNSYNVILARQPLQILSSYKKSSRRAHRYEQRCGPGAATGGSARVARSQSRHPGGWTVPSEDGGGGI